MGGKLRSTIVALGLIGAAAMVIWVASLRAGVPMVAALATPEPSLDLDATAGKAEVSAMLALHVDARQETDRNRDFLTPKATNPVANGDFEAGRNGDWTEYSAQGWDLILNSGWPGGVTPHSGSWAVWLGGDDDEVAEISQTVSLPGGLMGMTLSYWYWAASVETGSGDDFYISVNGTHVVNLPLQSANNTGGWVEESVDLTSYAAQPTIDLVFHVNTDSAENSNVFLDDVGIYGATGGVYLPLVLKRYPPSDKYAVIVGVADFQCANDLNYTDDDARDFRQTLIDYGGFESENIYMLIDSQATKSAIRNAITDWLDSREDAGSLVVIFYSSHGTSASGHEYLVAHDSCYLSQCIRDDEFDGWLDNLESQEVVVIVDTCYSGGMIASGVPKGCQARCGSFRPVDAGETTVLAGDGFTKDVNQEGRIVMTACADDETSIELGPPYGHGLFTYYLLDGLTKSSVDTSGNGWVSAEEVFPYLYPRVVSVNSDQHPQMTDDIAGEVDLTQP